MNDREFIETLKRKKEAHLKEMRRHQILADNIENLINEYSNSSQQDTEEQYPLHPLKESDSNGLHDLNLTEAIAYIMKTKQSKAWRGTEIKKALEARRYILNNLGQKISARLKNRAKAKTGKWLRIEGSDGNPRYRLREEFGINEDK